MRSLVVLLLVLPAVFSQSNHHHHHHETNAKEDLGTVDCSRLIDGNYANPDKKCSSMYVTCANGLPIARDCPPDTFFDELLDDCAEKSYVIACGGRPTRPAPSTTQPPVTQSKLEIATTSDDTIKFNCFGLRPGNYRDPSKEDGCSNIFFTCGAGLKPHMLICPGRTYYDDEIDACLYFADVPKCSGFARVITSTTEEGDTTTPTPDPYDCKKLPDGNYAPPQEETTCPKYFYQCANRRGFRVDCPVAGLRYDINQDACVAPYEIPACVRDGPN